MKEKIYQRLQCVPGTKHLLYNTIVHVPDTAELQSYTFRMSTATLLNLFHKIISISNVLLV